MQYPHPNKVYGILASTALVFVLAGCNGGGSGGGSTSTPPYSGPTTNLGQLSNADWAALTIKGTVTSVTMGAAPVVKFRLTDGNGTPLTGAGTWQIYSSTTAPAYANSYANISFSLAKLVPASGGTPSHWVNYIVTSVPKASTPTAWVPGKPSTDSQGALVDNGDGTYQYTFAHDITQAQAQLDAYTYTGNNVEADLGDVSYQPGLTHRLTVQVGGSARNTGNSSTHDANTPTGGDSGVAAITVQNPANLIYDFIPSTGKLVSATDTQRDIVTTASCNACHTKLGASFHSNTRVDVRYCVVCHTDQRKYGSANAASGASATPPTTYSGSTSKIAGRAVGEFPEFIHRLHMGEALTNTGYNYGGILFNEVRYPQDIRNCQTCHTSQPQSAVTDAPPTATVTTQGDNWMSVPSRYACGACHDSIDWVAGTNHLGGAQTSDAACSGCHSASDIAIYHTPVWTPHQAGSDLAVAHGGMQSNSYQATNPANLPKGAHRIEWNIKSVSVSSAGIPSITFQYLKDGIPVAFNTNTSGEMMDGFVNNSFSTTESNGPNLALAVGITQDGIAAPADYNFHTSWPIKNIWNGTAKVLDTDGVTLVPVGTFSGPTNGFYTITLTKFPLLNSQLPAGDTFGAVGMGIGLGLLTQSDLTAAQDAALKSNNVTMDFTFTPGNATTRNIGGLLLPSKMKWASVPVVSGQAVPSVQRRTILKEGSCNSCHSTLGAFTAVTGPANFHSVGIGDANAEQSCVLCHNTTGTDGSAWSYNTKTWVHALHASTNAGATMRNNAYTAHSSSGSDFWNIEYPGLLNNCEACHVAGSYDFSNTASAAQVPKMLWDTVAKGTTSASSPSYPTSGFTIIPTGTTPAVWTSGNKYLAPWVDQTTEYGTNVSITAPANVGANWTVNQPAVNTTSSKGSLVVSPITAACSACHDSASDIAHFKSNGGAFYEDRVTALATKTEQCLICHGSGGVADIKTVHSF